MKLRIIKDAKEIEYIQKASNVAVKGITSAINTIDTNVNEAEIAAEAIYTMI